MRLDKIGKGMYNCTDIILTKFLPPSVNNI